ncbi:MAG: sulfatase-like hydrolase/transferase, partial [Campylobacterota bacterium]|nr:sulfatase-like hydrolase/transferase [Campylobacterota bacterium]
MQEYKIFLKYWLFFISIGAIFRAVLIFLFVEKFDFNIISILFYGVRMDTIAFSAFSIIFVLFYTFNFIKVLKILLTLFTSIYFILEISTLTFMDYFLTRPNYLFVEYLKNYSEMFNMVFGLYKIEVMMAIPFLLAIFYGAYQFFNKTVQKGEIKKRLILLPLVLVVLALGARSSLDSSTPNKSFYTFNNSNIDSEIANNTMFSILYSIYLMKKEKFYDYGNMKYEDAVENVQVLNSFNDNKNSFIRFQKSTFDRKKNVILVLLESFGHEYIGHLGGTDTTPNLDSLTEESLYFTNLYATGTRTSWGVSSILTGLYPLPSREYVKANKSLNNFYTVASTFKLNSYETTFLYSGDADFDNMRGFMLANGFDNVYGKESFNRDLKKYTWGYCDEDLYDRALHLIEKSKDKPYFLTLLTMSSHEPFDYPKGRVEPYQDAKLEGFANSIKYGDYAIGKFMKQLKERGALKNTIIAFIADHNPKAYGTF